MDKGLAIALGATAVSFAIGFVLLKFNVAPWLKGLIYKIRWPKFKPINLTPDLNACLLYLHAKGALIEGRSDVCIVTTHANPKVGTVVGTGDGETRKIAKMKTVELPKGMVAGGTGRGALMAKDITVAKLDRPLPGKGYYLTRYVKEGEYVLVVHKDGRTSQGRLRVKGGVLDREVADRPTIPGDSGGPWFVQRGNRLELVSHSVLGFEDYAISYVAARRAVLEAIKELDKQ